MAGSKVSVREISRRTGYSPSTVSNALNHKPGVGEEAADAIRKVAEELGYHRSCKLSRIQFLIARNSGGILDEGSFRLAIINGIEYEARQRGLLTAYTTVELSDHATRERFIKSMTEDPTCGIVLLGTEMTQKDYDLFDHSKAPLVVVDGASDNHFFESIVFSNEGSSYRAVNHLIRSGHREIGYLAGKLRIRNFGLRERGYRRALEEAGVPVRPEFRVELGSNKPESAFHDMAAWLESKPKMPTAFFADYDALAVGAIQALSKAGYRVPDDVSVVGFDDLEFAAMVHPPLTTVHVPRFDIGRMAARKLIERAENPEPFTCVTHLSTAFVERESVRTL